MALEILYEDKDMLVCVKPPKVLSQSDRSMDYDMVSRVKNYLNKKDEDTYAAIINRLDRPVSGITVFAKNKKAAALMSVSMREHDFSKFYLAVAEPVFPLSIREGKSIKLTDYILKDTKTNTSKVVKQEVKGAKLSSLIYTVLKFDKEKNLALTEVELITGRHHQIRVQMANVGMPLYGDTKYGNNINDGKFKEIALCAYKMIIRHPITGETMSFEITPTNFPITPEKNNRL